MISALPVVVLLTLISSIQASLAPRSMHFLRHQTLLSTRLRLTFESDTFLLEPNYYYIDGIINTHDRRLLFRGPGYG
jgi:hypothetical protein